ncbi:hypothetical protein Y032_0464g1936 [Ancylostoma ceylanicum]|uniref:Uncharacterized protein n=1 Tax=Ancylostoma ceylanicum TaxID=53326 RepID=A0A016WZ93_9BILA|nr:hypothetical protein Y032_0464g1936 [Ancylostoma ceylanicum]
MSFHRIRGENRISLRLAVKATQDRVGAIVHVEYSPCAQSPSAKVGDRPSPASAAAATPTVDGHRCHSRRRRRCKLLYSTWAIAPV